MMIDRITQTRSGLSTHMKHIFLPVHTPISVFAVHSQKKSYYYSYIGSYLKAVRAIAEIWKSILCFTVVLKPQLQPEVANHCLYTVQTTLKFAAGSFCCKITLI